MYYLETNALRAISRRLRVTPIETRRTLFTSVLAVFELISGITEGDFQLRRAFVCDVSKSKLRIDWRSPSQVIANSFGQSIAPDALAITTRRAFFVIAASNSLANAISTCEKHQPPIDMARLVAAKGRLSQVYVAARALQNGEYQSQINSEPLKTLLATAAIDSASKRRALIEEFTGDLDEKLLRDAASATLANMSALDSDPTHLLSSYDGSIDRYIQASRWLQFESMLLQNPAGENDAPDVLHFLYVGNDATMVSSDKLSARIAAALWPERVISIPHFLRDVTPRIPDTGSTC